VGVDDPAETEADLPTFGRWLVRERELRGLQRDEVTRATRLAPGVVEALESGEEGRIPPRAYVVGYLRSYAQAVGLDPDEVVLRFREADRPDAGPAVAARRPRVAPAAILGAGIAVAAAVAALWAIFGT
jgi:cytoskeletal protein RodZ